MQDELKGQCNCSRSEKDGSGHGMTCLTHASWADCASHFVGDVSHWLAILQSGIGLVECLQAKSQALMPCGTLGGYKLALLKLL